MEPAICAIRVTWATQVVRVDLLAADRGNGSDSTRGRHIPYRQIGKADRTSAHDRGSPDRAHGDPGHAASQAEDAENEDEVRESTRTRLDH